MFSYAIWGQNRRQLFFARDRLGIKPFYYFWNGRLFAFASEIKVLLEHPDISTEFNDKLLPEYLAFGYIKGEGRCLPGFANSMPGHTLTLELVAKTPSLEIKQYWDAPVSNGVRRPCRAVNGLAIVERRLEEVVRMRLMSDVPLGMFLSGGVDSSAIAALIQAHDRRASEDVFRRLQ